MKRRSALQRGISFLLVLCLLLLPLNAQSVSAAENVQVARLAGSDRFRTSIQTADRMKTEMGVEKFDTIIVASGTNFADALSGSYLAAVKKAPILLTCASDFNASLAKTCNDLVAAYIQNNLSAGGTVYILGGTKAVDSALEKALSGFTVKRLAGASRFETNLLILKEGGVKDGDEILVCTSNNFADSLSASATGKPILLVYNELGNLFGIQSTYLAGLKNCTFTILGGTGAVSEKLAGIIGKYGTTTRLAGKNRFETSVLVAEKYFKNPDTVVLAYGWNYPDGLCGGALASVMDAPLILTMNGYEAAAKNYVQKNLISGGVVLGGTGLISDKTLDNIFGTWELEEVTPEETVPEETTPEDTTPEETTPEETTPEETTPEETTPEETTPEETTPEETTPEETTPAVTPPAETLPEDAYDENVVDLTEKLDSLMEKNAAIMQNVLDTYGFYLAGVYYYAKVTDGGDWDIKRTDEWKFEEGKTYVYQGVVMRMDDPGNIHFGYVGAVLFSEEFVCFGAGMNNVSKFGFTAGSVESYYDDPQDQTMMRWGYHMYEEDHGKR